MNVYSYVLCVLRAKISNYNAGSITLAWCMRPCRVLSRISQLTKPDLAFGLRHVARTRVSASIKTILHVLNTGPAQRSVVIVSMVRLNYNNNACWSGRIASLQEWSTRINT